MTTAECFCDKVASWTETIGCICNQNCYVPRPCDYCGPDGCANSLKRSEAQALIAGAINEAMRKAGDSDLEVDPETIMAGIDGPKTRKRKKKS